MQRLIQSSGCFGILMATILLLGICGPTGPFPAKRWILSVSPTAAASPLVSYFYESRQHQAGKAIEKLDADVIALQASVDQVYESLSLQG